MNLNNLPERIARRLKITWEVFLWGEKRGIKRDPIPPITLDEITEVRTFFPMPKFFIFGHARSGTTLLNRLVSIHPEVHSNRQAHFFTRRPFLQGLVADPMVAEWLNRKSVRWNRGRDLSPVVMRAAADFILEREARQLGKTIVGDKSPSNLMNGEAVRLMHEVYPDARLVYIVRDGRDAVLSHRFQAFIDATQHLNRADLRIRKAFIEEPEQFKSPDRSLFTSSGIREYAAGWVKNVTETERMGKELFGEQYLSLRFEDMMATPTETMLQIWGFLGADITIPGLDERIAATLVENRDAKWQEEKAGEMAKAIPKGSKGSWREFFSDRDKQIFKEIAGETLVAWGYERDLNW